MKPFKMLLEKVRNKLTTETGTVSTLDLITAKVQVKLSTGLIYISSRVERAMSKIQLAASATRFLAKETIARRTIEQIKPVEFKWQSDSRQMGFTAQTVASWSAYNIPVSSGGTGQTATYVPNNNITFQSPTKAILTITGDGDVIWNGKPSEAADIMVRSFGIAVSIGSFY